MSAFWFLVWFGLFCFWMLGTVEMGRDIGRLWWELGTMGWWEILD